MNSRNSLFWLCGLLLACGGFAHGQQVNPNNLPLCPKDQNARYHNCWGLYTTTKGDKYVGEFKDGKYHGQGNYTYADGNNKYVGEFKEGKFDGQGTATFANGNKYVGEFKDDSRHGQGTATLANGTKYVGEWMKGKQHGRGVQTQADSRRFEGIFENGKFVRAEVINLSDRSQEIAAGNWQSVLRSFESTTLDEEKKDLNSTDNEILFSVNPNNLRACQVLSDNKPNYGLELCWGSINWKNGDKYIGEIKYGMQHGLGNTMWASGDEHIGLYEQGMIRAGKFIKNESRLSSTKKESVPNVVDSNDRNTLIRERQQLAEERRRLEEDKRQREQQRQSQRLRLNVFNSQPSNDGSFNITIQTNADTASLKINGEEQGGKVDGNYSIKRVARVGQDTQFTITATDIYGNSDTKTITVTRQAALAADTSIALKPEAIKRAPARDAVAIIIGIQDYKRVPKAEFANNDAREFYEYAIRALGIKQEKIKMLLDDEADEVNIVKAFENWLPIQVNKDKTDVYVFYSGHGLPAPDGKSLYFLPHGVDKELLSRTAVGQNEIVAALSAAKPKSVTMFIDACYSGQTRGGDVLLANAKPLSLKSDANAYPSNFTVITASANDQISSSSPELKHGIFSFYLMKGMEGEADANKDGKITVGEMQDYLSDKVSRQAMTLNRKQSTQLVGDGGRVLVGR